MDSFCHIFETDNNPGGEGDVTNLVPLSQLLQGEAVVHYVQSQLWS